MKPGPWLWNDFLADLSPASRRHVTFLGEATRAVARRSKGPLRFLEVGAGWGISACTFLRCPRVALFSVDFKFNRDEYTRRTEGLGVRHRIAELKGDSADWLPLLLRLGCSPFDLVYIDGDHSVEAVRRDLANALPLLAPDGVVYLDDVGEEKFPGVLDMLREETARLGLSLKVHPVSWGVAEVRRLPLG